MQRLLTILTCFALIATISWLTSVQSVHAMTMIVVTLLLVLVIAIVQAVSRRFGAVNALGVYTMLIAIALTAVVLLWMLSFVDPLLFTAAVTVLAGATIFLGWTRREPQRRMLEVSGKCPECGYDLRASEDRCPECGADLPEEIVRRRRIAAELALKRRQNASPTDLEG